MKKFDAVTVKVDGSFEDCFTVLAAVSPRIDSLTLDEAKELLVEIFACTYAIQNTLLFPDQLKPGVDPNAFGIEEIGKLLNVRQERK